MLPKKSYLGRLNCYIFGISTVIFRMEFSRWHGFSKLFSPFQGPNRFVALLSSIKQTIPIPQRIPHANFLRKNISFPFQHDLYGSRHFDDLVYIENRIFLEGFYHGSDQTTRKCSFQAFTSFHLTH